MNWNHLSALVWLRWRLRVNQLRRGGVGNQVVLAILAALVVMSAASLFVGGLVVGAAVLPQAPPVARVLVWDAAVAGFGFVWLIGLMAELQRAEGLSMAKLLPLPVSPAGGFAVNYVGSLANLTLATLGPGFAGLAAGAVSGDGPPALLLVPLLVSAGFALTAVTYQFQGWLAGLMTNPRRRRAVVAGVTVGVVLVSQLPNVAVQVFAGNTPAGPADAPARLADKQREAAARFQAASAALRAEFAAGTLTEAEFRAKSDAADADMTAEARRVNAEFAPPPPPDRAAALAQYEPILDVVNTVLPPGWVAAGAAGVAAGNPLPALLGTLGFVALGAVSLRMAYRATVRYYTGEADRAGGRVTGPAADPARVRLVEWTLPRVPEAAAGVAAGVLRALSRAPEVKMLLVFPVIMIVVVGGLLVRTSPPAGVRPFVAFGAAAAVVFGGLQVVLSQFSLARTGFRALVLGPVPRRTILLGFNLAAATVTLIPAALAAGLVGLAVGARFDHVVAAAAQAAGLSLVALLIGNAVSIAAPFAMQAGGFKSSDMKLMPVLAQFAAMLGFTAAAALAVSPFAAELLLAEAGATGWPVALALSLLGLAATVAVYRRGLTLEGDWLARRELAVLESVATKSTE